MFALPGPPWMTDGLGLKPTLKQKTAVIHWETLIRRFAIPRAAILPQSCTNLAQISEKRGTPVWISVSPRMRTMSPQFRPQLVHGPLFSPGMARNNLNVGQHLLIRLCLCCIQSSSNMLLPSGVDLLTGAHRYLLG